MAQTDKGREGLKLQFASMTPVSYQTHSFLIAGKSIVGVDSSYSNAVETPMEENLVKPPNGSDADEWNALKRICHGNHGLVVSFSLTMHSDSY